LWGTVEDKWGKVDNSRVARVFTLLELYTNFSTALSPTFTQGYPQIFLTKILGINRTMWRYRDAII
jgi:hypothetical protein